jgi:perosamine synthetase
VQKPALEGGKPQRKNYLPYGQHKLTSTDIAGAERVLRSKWITQGPVVDDFEKAFATKIGCRYAVSVNSGTAALHTAIASLGLRPSDEVLTTPLTFIATINSILYVGGKPVFADIDPTTLNLDAKDAEGRITENTKAVIFVHFAGNPAGFQDVIQLSRDRRLSVIDDASHALGARHSGKMIGSFTESITTFSFHPVKHITTGEGGMVATASESVAQFAKAFRNHGITREARERYGPRSPWTYDVEYLGWNYRLNDIGSAIGISQLKRLETGLARRAAIARFYGQQFKDLPQIEIPSNQVDNTHAWHLYTTILREGELRINRDRFVEALRAENIGATVHYPPAHLFSFHREKLDYKEGDFPVAESVSRRIVSLPIFPSMSSKDCEDVTQAVKKILDFYAK